MTVDTKAKLSTTDGAPTPDASFYRSIVGALQYLTLTRPELQYVVRQVCLHKHAPRDVHWSLVKRILRYIRGHMDLGITLQASPFTDIVAYSNADWLVVRTLVALPPGNSGTGKQQSQLEARPLTRRGQRDGGSQ
nr:uncharacterized mitochondrial protein AtMg00810-like [Aegilops tauschii subsp. strangulata]